MGTTPFEKTLRTNGTSTPRNKLNNRYGPVGTGSRGPIDADELDSPVAQQGESSAVGRNTTPRSAGRYGSPFGPTGFAAGNGSTPRGRSGLAPASRPPVPRQPRLDTDADAHSVAESDDVSVMTEDDYGPQEGDSVQVFVRVRPTNEAEMADAESYNCTRLYGERSVSVELSHRAEPYHFKFDCVLPDTTTQEEVFERAGKAIVDNCLGGYNSSIFAYGQTGAGKTYTMQGPLSAALQDDNPQRGLAPRVFQYLFSEIDKAQDEKCHENLTFSCKCSMLEIYNEVITDLVNPDATNLQIREDIKRGCYVEDLSSHSVQNVSDAMALMRKGAENRHTGETRLNRESSRSHSVFTCVLERQSKNQSTGITNVLFSRLNLIDLAGSERVHGGEHGGSQATGKHFKEACHINKSLTTLGRVITELVEAQRTGHARGNSSVGKGAPASRTRHVPYRDSRLTFLLQDSLGGNAKTLMIANISPCSVSGVETLSTLQFMSRAKCIRNRAKINLDSQGDVAELQREILRLNNELDNLRKGYTEPAIQEAKQLREELKVLRDSRGETEIRLVNLEKENHNLKNERKRLDNKLAQVQKGSTTLTNTMWALATRITTFEDHRAQSEQKAAEVFEMEKRVLQAELQAALQESQGASELQHVVDDLQQQLQEAQAAAASSSEVADLAAAEVAKLRLLLESEQQQNSSLAEEISTAQEEASELTARLAATQQQSELLTEQLIGAQQECAGLAAQLSSAQQVAATATQQLEEARQQAVSVQEQLEVSQQHAVDLETQLSNTQQGCVELSEQLAAVQQEKAGMQEELTAVQHESLGLAEQLAASQQCAADLQQQLTAARQGSEDLRQQLEAAQQDAVARANQTQEEREATQAQLSGLRASLDASTAHVQSLQQEVQEGRDETQALKADGDELRQQLAQQHEQHALTMQTLADVQRQLGTAQRELEQAKEMATCSEAEAGKRLSDALAAADAAQQAVQEQRSTNTGLAEQLTALQEQLAQARHELHQQEEARKQDGDAAASSQAAAEAIEQQLREQLEATQAQLAAKQECLEAVGTEQQELASKLGLKQQQYSELQQQLAVEQDRSAEKRAQIASLEQAMAELNSLVKEKGTALESAQEQVKQLQQAGHHKDDALAAAVAKHEQLSSDLASLREGSKGKQDELMKQVTDVHLQLSAAQQEQERLQEELDGVRNDNGALQAQLADAQAETDNFRGQASSKGLEVELLRKKLSAADTNIGTLRSDMAEAQQEAAALRGQVQDLESVAGESQAAAEEQLSDLKRTLLDKEQMVQEYEYERSQMQRRMEELSQRLMDKSSSLEGSRSEIQTLKSTIRDQSNAARRQEAALADQSAYARQLQAENASLCSHLQEVSEQLADREAELRNRLTSNELQLKEQIVYNARNRQAMNEIRKVINWAQQLPAASTPPHPSRPSSSASRRIHPQVHGHLEAGSIPGSPAGSHYGDLLAVEQHFEAPEQLEDQQGRGVPPALLLPGGQLAHQGSGGSNSSSSRHHGSHSHGHSRHHHQHQGHAVDRYGEPVGSGGTSRAASEAGSISGRRTGKGSTAGSPSKLAARAGEHLPVMLQVSEDLHSQVAATAAAEEPAGSSTYCERDTAGGAPASPALSEAASSSACMSAGHTGSGRARGHRMGPGSPTRSSGSKQQLAAALAAAQHKLLPDQQHHQVHSTHGHHARAQDRYAAEVEDDTLGAPVQQDSFEEAQEGQAYGSRGRRREAAGEDRHLMAPQQASSPVPPSPNQEGQHSSTSRNRGGRDSSSRRGLRAGSDTHSFGSMVGKRHKMVPGEAHPLGLSVSGDWSAGGSDSLPRMQLPPAITGDEGAEV